MTTSDARRSLPKIGDIVEELERDAADVSRPVLVDLVRTVVTNARRRARRTKTVPTREEIVAMCVDALDRRRGLALRPVINATGVVLHTNLGRAPLSQDAIDAVATVARGYSNLEWDPERGDRGDRYVHVEPLLAVLMGAEAALVVNNNAAAVLLVCTALAAGREVVVSRGELIEIGGGFRIPEILESTGATLHEVGTTNKTHLRDYEKAITGSTAFVLKVHPSNYRVVGFTATPEIEDVARIAHAAHVPLVYDAGSGLVGRTFADEPAVDDALRAGADLVCFSGDKLFGGPQAGIIAGSSDLIAQLRSHPLLRAIRPDKMQLAALGATVTAYLNDAADDLPVWRMLGADLAALAKRCTSLLKKAEQAGYDATVAPGGSVAGGGSLPGHEIDSPTVRIKHATRTAKELAHALRVYDPPVVARIEDGSIILDPRTVDPDDDDVVVRALRAALSPS